MALIGYARVSTHDQNPDLQENALLEAGCARVFTDRASGALRDRPQLTAALGYVRPGDVLVCWRLDRLGRSLTHLLGVIQDLASREVGFRSLCDPVDTTSASGRLTLAIFGAVAEFEKDLLRERTVAGLAAARARGRVGGRKPSLSPKKIEIARHMYEAGDSTVSEIAAVLGVSRATVYRHLKPAGGDLAMAAAAG